MHSHKMVNWWIYAIHCLYLKQWKFCQYYRVLPGWAVYYLSCVLASELLPS